jgi:ABC-type lipoprotein release transport system permease subunit
VDPVTAALIGFQLIVTTGVAALWPAWRAIRIDPARALREQ